MDVPQTHYASSGDVSIAWQKFGVGRRRIVFAPGFDSANLMNFSEGGAMCQLFAATWPQRIKSLVLQGSSGSFRQWVRSGGDADGAAKLLEPAASAFEVWKVATEVGNVRKNGPELLNLT